MRRANEGDPDDDGVNNESKANACNEGTADTNHLSLHSGTALSVSLHSLLVALNRRDNDLLMAARKTKQQERRFTFRFHFSTTRVSVFNFSFLSSVGPAMKDEEGVTANTVKKGIFVF